MITFETQEEFDDAVMQVIRDRLKIDISVHSGYYDYSERRGTKVEVTLRDFQDYYNVISSAEDNA